MFTKSAPWVKESPVYVPQELAPRQTEGEKQNSRTQRATHARNQRVTQAQVYEFRAPGGYAVEEAPKRRLCKSDFRRLQRFQHQRQAIGTACEFATVAMLMFGWLVPVWMVSHGAAVCAMAHKCGSLIQAALSNPAVKSWLGMVYSA